MYQIIEFQKGKPVTVGYCTEATMICMRKVYGWAQAYEFVLERRVAA